MTDAVLVRVDSYVLHPNEEDATVSFWLEGGDVEALVPIGEVDRFRSTVRGHLVEHHGGAVRVLFAPIGGRRAMVQVPDSRIVG